MAHSEEQAVESLQTGGDRLSPNATTSLLMTRECPKADSAKKLISVIAAVLLRRAVCNMRMRSTGAQHVQIKLRRRSYSWVSG